MKSIEFLGVRVTGATIEELNGLIRTAVETGEKWILANHNLHSLYLFHHDEKLRGFFSRAKLAHADGMSLILLARLFGLRLSRNHRVTYVDWVYPLMKQAAERGWRVCFVGGRPGVGLAASEILANAYPGLYLKVHHGYFDSRPGSTENIEVLRIINDYRPHVLMVGMGMPLQEHWIFDNLDLLQVNAILPAGACMDYVAGCVPIPPRWMGRVGLEWLFRLGCEPKRLARRYLVEPWFIARLLAKDLWQRLADFRKAV